MEVLLEPVLQAKLEHMARESGRAPADLVQDAVAGYMDELTETRAMLDSRYDDLQSGKVKLVPGEEVEAYFREKSAEARSQTGR